MAGNPLVIKDEDRFPLLVGQIRVGWRVPCENGEYLDVMWGATKNEDSLKLLLQDVERQYGRKEIIDERKKVA